jgi:hypothetical protein
VIYTLNAKRLEKVMTTGRTKPLVIVCDRPDAAEPESDGEFCDSELPVSMLVKAMGLPEVREDSLFCEFAGNILARAFGILTPSPALISLSPEFASIANEVLKPYKIEVRPGIGVGCKFLPPFSPIVGGSNLKEDEIDQASRIYAFDLFFQNPDRRIDRPNCASYRGQIIAFDFEMAFSFLMPILNQKPEWKLSEQGISEKHFFRASLKGKPVDWTPSINMVKIMVNNLNELLGALPESWQNYAGRVQQHIEALVSNIEELEFELHRSLL